MDADEKQDEIIRMMPVIHCARGPKRCEKCAEGAKNVKPCLLRIFEDGGLVARPIIEVERGGQRFVAFDIIKRFESKEKAIQYAEEHKIDDIEL